MSADRGRSERDQEGACQGAFYTSEAPSLAVAALNQTIGINVSAPTKVVDLPEEPPFDLALAQGAVGCTTNPAYSGGLLKRTPDLIRPLAAQMARARGALAFPERIFRRSVIKTPCTSFSTSCVGRPWSHAYTLWGGHIPVVACPRKPRK